MSPIFTNAEAKSIPIDFEKENNPQIASNESILNHLSDFAQLLRIKQWSKNIFVFAGLLFTTKIIFSQVLKIIFASILFCGISSCVYIINDMVDLKKDRLHPVKRFRPLASGRIQVKYTRILLYILSPLIIFFSFTLNLYFGIIIVIYLSINLLYSLKLKEFLFVDLIMISFGFILRSLSGILLMSEKIPVWFLLSILFLSLFLGINKRKQELITLKTNQQKHRKNLGEYSVELINQIVPVLMTCVIICYMLHVFFETGIKAIFLTVPVVIYGILRYQYLVTKEGYGENPELILLSDKPIDFALLLWGVIYISAKYIFVFFNVYRP